MVMFSVDLHAHVIRLQSLFALTIAHLCPRFHAGGDPDQFRGALPDDVTTGGVPLDDAEDQTHGRAVGQRHPLAGCKAEPGQAAEEEGGHDR